MYGLLTKREVKLAGYRPSSFLACLWTEAKSRSTNTQKKNEGLRVKMQNYRETVGHLFSLGNFPERYSPTLPTHKENKASAEKVN